MQIKEMFTGIRVLELASVLAGPSVGQFFAEVGAEVIKIENPNTGGDVTRGWKLKDENTESVSAYFSCTNWGKKSVILDITTEKDRSLLYKLVGKSDFVIVNYKSGDAEKLKVDYESLKAVKKDIIYGEITGYGTENPKVGYDAVIQAESGFMYINGETGSEPLKMPVAIMDLMAGHQLKEAMLLAYIKKLKSGQGSFISVSLIEAAIASLANQATNWLVGKQDPQRKGSSHPNIAPYGDIFKTKDNKRLLLAVGTDRQFVQLCEYFGLQELKSDPRFKTNKARVLNRDELNNSLSKTILTKTLAVLIHDFNRLKIPAGGIRSIAETLASKDAERCLIDHETLQGVRTFVAFESNLKNSSHFLPPPFLGQHTQEILEEL